MKTAHRILSAGLPILLAGSLQAAEFSFQKGDRVALIGNSLADRMQHDGWLETLIQSKIADQKIRFRNLGFTGDQVASRKRAHKNYGSAEDFLKIVKADVILCFFGYNESFAGDGGIDGFKNDLNKMIDNYRALKPNGKSEPRIVLFSPIAHENLKTRNLPNGKANNNRLAKYSEAMSAVAKDKNVLFVDLFGPSQKIYAASSEPLTINGIHLSEHGNKKIGEVMASTLLGTEVSASSGMEDLRKAVQIKNWHWFNRYRATDGNDVWGGRSTLKFVGEQMNADVLKHELKMLDVMTDNRDPRIWARAKGRDMKINDGNVPKAVPVVSNVGGKGRMSSAQKEGSLDYLSGRESLKKLTYPDNFEVNLFADEDRFPELVNPVQMQVDGKGRLWVAAWKSYPKWEPLTKMEDRLLIFPDENRDGIADKCITFAKVHNPLGFEFWNGGVLVTSQPDIIFLKDTDGDDVADFRQVYVQGIGSADTHHAANNFIYGPDGAIYWQSGIFMINTIEHPWGPPLSTGASAMYRFDPRRYTISFHANNRPNPHGISFDRWGYHYANDGTGGNTFQVRPDGNGFKMHQLLNKQVRPVPANEVVSSANFPDEMQQDFLICNTIGYLGIKHYDLHRDGYTRTVTTGKGDKKKTREIVYKVGEVWGEPAKKTNDFIHSSDRNFRPTDAIFGSDGALYIADWHNVIIGHMQHNVRDPNRDHKHGRVFRMVAKGRPLQEPVPIDGAPLSQLMENLEHPIDGVRHRTRIELSERDTGEVIAACQQWIKQWDVTKKEHAHHLLEALWLHQQHNIKNPGLMNSLLKSPEPQAVVAAKTVQHHWYTADPTKSSPAVPEETEVVAQKKSGVLSDGPDGTVVRIGTIVEQLQYDIKEFEVKAGKKVKLTFVNPDFMPHNIVFVQPGAEDEIGMAAIQLGAKGFEKQFIPDSDKIFAYSKLVDHGKEETLEFKAPAKPGNYPFICTFPGHHIVMRGIMKVK